MVSGILLVMLPAVAITSQLGGVWLPQHQQNRLSPFFTIPLPANSKDSKIHTSHYSFLNPDSLFYLHSITIESRTIFLFLSTQAPIYFISVIK